MKDHLLNLFNHAALQGTGKYIQVQNVCIIHYMEKIKLP
jgi:hypothetical protein